jgi:hypothetical protein
MLTTQNEQHQMQIAQMEVLGHNSLMGKYQNYSYFLLVQEPEAGGKVERY